MVVIATRTDAAWGLVEEDEYISTNNGLKEIFLEFGWVKPHNPTDPLPPKGLNDYEPGKSYPKDRYIILNNEIIQSNCVTSTTFVSSEWDVKIKGA